jgi:peptide/nickel transport system permease protein
MCFVEFFQTQDPQKYLAEYSLAPPQAIHFIDHTTQGTRFRLYVFGYTSTINQVTFEKKYVVDKSMKNYLRFFGKSEKPYKLMGFIPMNIRFLAPSDYNKPFFLLGSDNQGRDLYSRLLQGTRISLTVGLIGIFISLIIGIIIGGISGYYGGHVDNFIQRLIEFIRSLPEVPLWLALAAAIPKSWDSFLVYLIICIILSFISWTTMARVVRGKFIAIKSQDFIAAAKLDGAGKFRIIIRHMTPLFISHIIATVTLSIPSMILGETALSFLGLGLQPPVVSWGVLLQQCRSIRVLSKAPWLLIPTLFVIFTVLAMNFMGDGLRDAADPYHTR